jgi:hypothetical protein
VVEGGWDFGGAELDGVGEDVALEAGLEGFGEAGGGFDEEGVGALPPDEEGGAEFAFGGEEAGWAGFGGLESGDIDADLAVEVSEGVGAAEFEADAAGDFEESGGCGGVHDGRSSDGGGSKLVPSSATGGGGR